MKTSTATLPAPTVPSSSPALPPSSSPSASTSARATRVGRYQIGKTLGHGTFGKVKYAINLDTREGVAMKVMDKARIRASHMGDQIRKEITIMKTLQHENVIRLIEVLSSEIKVYIVMELVTGGELYDMVIAKQRFNEDEARHYFRQLIAGLSYCHERGVFHRDLKPENLLLDVEGTLKISDFGLSTLEQPPAVAAGGAVGVGGEGGGGGSSPVHVTRSGDDSASSGPLPHPTPLVKIPDIKTPTPSYLLHTTCGSPNYVAPEVLMDQGYDGRAADIWSAGVILYVLLAGHLPFDEASMINLFRKIVHAEFSFPEFFSSSAVDLLSKILTPNPEQRATMQTIKVHPWFRHGVVPTHKSDEEKLLIEPLSIEDNSLGVEFAQTHQMSSSSSQLQPSVSSPLTPQNFQQSGLSTAAAMKLPLSSFSVSSTASPVASPASHPPTISSRHIGSTDMEFKEASSDASSILPIQNHQVARSFHRSESEMFLTIDEDDVADELKARTEAEVVLDNPRSHLSEELSGARQLNAFDLINIASGVAMNRMFLKRTQPLRYAKVTQYTSTQSVDDILDELSRTLDSMSHVTYRVYTNFAQVRVVFDSSRGRVFMLCQLYEMTPQLHLIECTKMKGDIFLYHELYKDLRRRQIDGTLGKPSDFLTSELSNENLTASSQSYHRLLQSASNDGSPKLSTSSRSKLSILVSPAQPLNNNSDSGDNLYDTGTGSPVNEQN